VICIFLEPYTTRGSYRGKQFAVIIVVVVVVVVIEVTTLTVERIGADNL
jgi:hypothetical protein